MTVEIHLKCSKPVHPVIAGAVEFAAAPAGQQAGQLLSPSPKSSFGGNARACWFNSTAVKPTERFVTVKRINRPPVAGQRIRSAFTLTELLVVVAIIGILAALLLPALSAARKRSQLIQCVHNLHQQGLGLQEFVTDYHVYPLAFNANYYSGAYPEHQLVWMRSIARELNARTQDTNAPPAGVTKGWTSVFRCPAAVNWSVRIDAGGRLTNPDYGYNDDGLARSGPGDNRDLNSLGLGGVSVGSKENDYATAPPIKPSAIQNPNDMLAIGDGFSGDRSLILDMSSSLSRNWNWNLDTDRSYLNYKQISQWVHARHQGRANMVFCDGHVETLTLKFLFQDTNDAALTCWNRDHLPHREELSR